MKKILFLLIFLPLIGFGQTIKKGSELTPATSINDSDNFFIIQSGTTKRIAYSVFRNNSSDVASQISDSLVNYATLDTIAYYALNDTLQYYVLSSDLSDTISYYVLSSFLNDTLSNYLLDSEVRSEISDSLSGFVPAAAGNENEIQLNRSGVLDGSPNFTWNDTTLTIDDGYENIFIGYNSGNDFLFVDVGQNTCVGAYSGQSITNGGQNTLISQAGYSLTTGDYNVMLGLDAGANEITGSNNVFLGSLAGYNNINGNNNIFLGYQAGYNEAGSNKLYIENSNSSTPLIYGEFDNDKLRFNADTSTFAGHVKVDSNIYVYGRAIFDKYEVAAYIDPDSTVTTSINSTTWTFLGDGANNKFTNLYTEGFSLDGDTLQFDQEITDLRDSIEFRFSAHALTSSSSVNKTIFYTIQIKSVGESTYTEIRQITSGSQTSTAGVYYPGPTCTTMPVYLKDGDKIQIVAKCAASTTDINTKYGKVYLREE